VLDAEIKKMRSGERFRNAWVRIKIGAIFCRVVKVQHIGHVIEFITEGNQK